MSSINKSLYKCPILPPLMALGIQIPLPDDLFQYDLEPKPELLEEARAKTIICVSTYYPSKDGALSQESRLRSDLALDMFRKASDLGIKVVCSDGGRPKGILVRSDSEFLDHASSLDVHITFIPEFFPGLNELGKNFRHAMIQAKRLGARIIAHTEPEKHNMVYHEGTSPLLLAATRLLDGSADIVVPRRQDNLSSYPLYQQMSELTQNLSYYLGLQAYASTKGIQVPYLDVLGGARLIPERSLDYFLDYPGYIHTKDSDGNLQSSVFDSWHAVYVPIIAAILDKKSVKGVSVGYGHPKRQSLSELSQPQILKRRFDQLTSLIDCLECTIKSHSQNLLYTQSKH